jgi:hypothetical protein
VCVVLEESTPTSYREFVADVIPRGTNTRSFTKGKIMMQCDIIQGWEQRRSLPDLSEDQILAWADAYFARTGRCPDWQSGLVRKAHGETWYTVAEALALGLRGLPPGGSLGRLLGEQCDPVNQTCQHISIEQIVEWARAWRARTGRWPRKDSGEIPGSGGVTWRGVDIAIWRGLGVLPKGSSLSRVLRSRRRVLRRPPVTERQIVFWADAYHARSGQWPNARSGPIPESPGDTWLSVNCALKGGFRSLPGGSSLAELLIRERGIKRCSRERIGRTLTVAEILVWAQAYHDRHGSWPNSVSGPIPEAPRGESWWCVHNALKKGKWGLPAGSSLRQLLKGTPGPRPGRKLEQLTIKKILAWANAHSARTGRWPNALSGPIPEAPGEKWCAVRNALTKGRRGLRGGVSLARLRGAEHLPEAANQTLSRI